MSFLDYVPLIGDALGSIGTTASSMISDAGMRYASDMQYKSNQETNAMNLRIAETNNEAAKQLWREQSLYNSPKNQMARYLEAGLNPNLMASSGQVNSGNASSAPQLQQAVMRPYNGYVQTAIARANNLQRAVSSVTDMLTNIGNWQKQQQEIRTSKAQENYYNSQAENIDKLRPWRVMREMSLGNWLQWRNQYLRELDRQDPTGNSNYWKQVFNLARYNADIAYERSQNLKFMNMVNDMYGMENALWKLNYTKSATERNRIASMIQKFLAPAQFTNLMSLAALNDERTFGQTFANGLSAYNFQDRQTGGDFGFKVGGANFTLGGLMRAIFGLGTNTVRMFKGKAPDLYY